MIRSAQPEDTLAIATLWNAVIRDTALTFTSIEKTPKEVAAALSKQPFWVAELDGEVVGFATYGPFRAGPGYARTVEHSVYLADGARGRGIGRVLLGTCEDHARASGKHAMIAGVAGENRTAIRFHERLGYRTVAQMPEVGWKFGRWHDLILLQKML